MYVVWCSLRFDHHFFSRKSLKSLFRGPKTHVDVVFRPSPRPIYLVYILSSLRSDHHKSTRMIKRKEANHFILLVGLGYTVYRIPNTDLSFLTQNLLGAENLIGCRIVIQSVTKLDLQTLGLATQRQPSRSLFSLTILQKKGT